MMTNAQAALLAAVQMSHDPEVIERYARQCKRLLDVLDEENRHVTDQTMAAKGSDTRPIGS